MPPCSSHRIHLKVNHLTRDTIIKGLMSALQIKGLEQENKHLGQTVSSLRQRCQVGAEARVKDVEKENRILHESICETTAKLNKMEFERKQIRK